MKMYIYDNVKDPFGKKLNLDYGFSIYEQGTTTELARININPLTDEHDIEYFTKDETILKDESFIKTINKAYLKLDAARIKESLFTDF